MWPQIQREVLIRDRKGHTETQGRRRSEDGDRDWSDESAGQGRTGARKGAWSRLSLRASRGANPTDARPPTAGALPARVPSRVGQAAAPLRRAVSLLCEVTCARAWSLEYQQWRGPLTLAVSSPMK